MRATLRLLVLAISLITLLPSPARALDVAPGTTSGSLAAEGCAIASGGPFGLACGNGCIGLCDLPGNEAQASFDIGNFTEGKKFVATTVYSDFTVTAGEDGAATSLDATLSYDVSWKGGWTIAGVFPGFNDVQSSVALTVTDVTNGGATIVRDLPLHSKDVDGFLDIEIVEVGFGIDEGSTVNTMDIRVVRGHTYRVGLTVRCEGKGYPNATVHLDYLTGGWGVRWNDLKVTVGADLAEEIAALKRRVEALESHTHHYRTGRGEGHNNVETETSPPLLVEEPSDDERRLLPIDDPAAQKLPVPSLFLHSAPNPAHARTTIRYTLPQPLRVTIRLYSADGKLARTLADEALPAGAHDLAFDGAGLAPGVYYYRLQAGPYVETRKLTLLE